MSTQLDFNAYLTEGFSGEFRRRGNILFDKHGKALGSVTKKSVYDLNGNVIAELVKEEYITDDSGKKSRVAEYGSATRSFGLRADKLYLLGQENEEWLGRMSHTERNAVHIALLGVLAFFLTATVILIALIGLPVANVPVTPGVEPPPDDDTVPVLDISDTQGGWEDGGVIGMFGWQVKPGDSGTYDFVIRNPHEDKTLDYSFWIEPRYNGGDISAEFPITFRIKMNNQMVAPGTFQKADEFKLTELLLMPDSQHAFTLEWNWAFEGNDENDTLIGIDGGQISLVLHISAQTRS